MQCLLAGANVGHWCGVSSGEAYRQIHGVVDEAKENKAGWSAVLSHLKQRRLRGVELIISDVCMGLVDSAAEFVPKALWQRQEKRFAIAVMLLTRNSSVTRGVDVPRRRPCFCVVNKPTRGFLLCTFKRPRPAPNGYVVAVQGGDL